ncbi:MAG: TonB-dependent SusC/RagA subfamily outer membrane receptor [Cyclobacteriaceae bacterium]|jgi:TonB-dependent SusC/RagA subfamily outer membrane receptor
MNWINDYFSQTVIQTLGTTFLHSIWLGLVAGIVVSVGLYLVKSKRSDLRFNISMGTMVLFFLAVLGTFIYTYSELTHSSHQLQTSSGDFELSSLANLESVQNDISPIESQLFNSIQSFLFQHSEVIVLCWLIGIVLLSVRFIGGFLYIRKLRVEGLKAVPREWHTKLENWAKKLDLRRIPTFYESTLVKSPVAFGYIKPIILFPLGMLTSMPVQHLDAMLTHELIHIKHSDYLINLFLSIVEILLFFNPIVWWLSGVIRAEMEHRCDDRAVLVTGNKLNYAYALVATQENQYFQDSQLALSMAKNRGHLTARINRLFDLKNNKSIAYGKPLISLIVLLLSVLLLAFSSPDENAVDPKEELGLATAAIDSLSNEFYFFNDKPIDKSTWDKVQINNNMGLAQGSYKEGNPYLRFFTMGYILDATNQFEEPLPESLLYAREGQWILVEGETKDVSKLNASNDSFKNAVYYFNNKLVDKKAFYSTREDSSGFSIGHVLEDRVELRFYTDQGIYRSHYKKVKTENISDFDKTNVESVLLVDGEERPMEYLEKLNKEKNIGWIGVNTGTHAEAISEKYKGKSLMVVKTKRGSSSNLIEKEIIEGVIGDSIKYKYYSNTKTLKVANKLHGIKTYISINKKDRGTSLQADSIDLKNPTYRSQINNYHDGSKPIMSKYYMLVARSMAKRQKDNLGFSPRVGFGYALTHNTQDSIEQFNGIKEKPGLTLINKIPHGVNQNGYSAFDTIMGRGRSEYFQGGRNIGLSHSLTKNIQDSIPPLILVDGVKVKIISDLNPNQIESISVLKDRSDTEVYGEEGANGVILITSKNIKESKRINDPKHIMDNKLQVNHRIVKRDNKFYLQGKVTGNITKQNVTDAFIRFDDNWQETFHTDENGEFEMEVPSGAKEIVIRHFMLPSVHISVDRQEMENEIFVSNLEKTLKIYPNPTIDHFIRIDLENEKKQWVVLKVFSVAEKRMVRTINRKTLKPGSYEFSLDSRKLDPGTYVLVVLKGTDKIERNFVVSH